MTATPSPLSKWLRFSLTILFATSLSSYAQTEEETSPETGKQRVARLLSAMGGKPAWSRVNIVIVEATHYALSAPTTYENRIVNDLTRPRVRFEGHAPAGIGGRPSTEIPVPTAVTTNP